MRSEPGTQRPLASWYHRARCSSPAPSFFDGSCKANPAPSPCRRADDGRLVLELCVRPALQSDQFQPSGLARVFRNRGAKLQVELERVLRNPRASEVRQSLEECARGDPRDPNVMVVLGRGYLLEGDEQRAALWFERALVGSIALPCRTTTTAFSHASVWPGTSLVMARPLFASAPDAT